MWLTTLRLGLLLGLRQIQHASIWKTSLVIFIITLTFLNLVGVSGILVGLIEGSVRANRNQYTGSVFISTPSGEDWIEHTNRATSLLETLPGIAAYSSRVIESGTIEANYRDRRDPSEAPDQVGTQFAGIDVSREDDVTGLSQYIVEGSYLTPTDRDSVIVGANWIQRYSADFGDGFDTLEDLYPGDKVRISVGGATQEMTVKGIADSKVNETSLRVFMIDTELRRMINRGNTNANEIAIRLAPGASETAVKKSLVDSGLDDHAQIRTSDEAIPQFLEDIKLAFSILGNIIGSIGIIVASITVFIIIYINAITRRKYIGILKGIGIKARAIEISYVVQSIFYAVVGALIGVVLLYTVIIPAVEANPINFPFSDGILVAPFDSTLRRFMILLLFALLAGFIPAWLIIRKNTLDSILGR